MSITILSNLNNEQTKIAPKSGGRSLAHYCIPRLNLYKHNDGIEFREFPLKCGYPQPIYMEEEQYSSILNHPNVLVQCKHNYKQRLFQLKNRIMKAHKNKLNMKLGKELHSAFFPLFVELLKQDPDKYFDGPYDWYYTGGSLTLLSQNDSNQILLLSATGKHLDKLRVSQQLNATTKITDLSKNASAIYETYRHKNYYMVRQKNHITGYCHGHTGDLLDLHEQFAIKSNVPFLSSAYVTDSKMVTIDADQIIKFWDFEMLRSDDSKHKIKRKIDNWGYLKNFKEPLVLYTNRSEFNILDFRVSGYKTIGTYSYENSYECNQIYGMANSKYDNLVYISANHALYGLDIRYLRKKLTMNTLSKWTHLMKLPPIMIETTMYNGDEYIYLSSSLRDNTKICVNKKNTVYSSPYLPYRPKYIADTYRKLQLQGHCIDPISEFGERINYATTGIGIFVRNDILHTITSNASGDIFYQKFDDDKHDLPADTISNTEKWVKYLRINRCSKITNMDRMNSLLLALQCKNLSLSRGAEDDIDKIAADRACPRPTWKRTINELYEYKDVLAKGILDVWDIKVSAGLTYCSVDKLESQMDTSELPYTSKIDDWFTRNNENDSVNNSIAAAEDQTVINDPSSLNSHNVPNTSAQREDIHMSQIFKTKRSAPVRRSARLEGF